MLVNKLAKISVVALVFMFCAAIKAETRNDSIRSFQIKDNIDDISNIELKKIIVEQLTKNSGDSLKLTDVESVKCLGKYNVVDLGSSRIYKIKLSYNLPNVWHYFAALIVDSHCNAYLVDLDLIELIKTEKNSSGFYFAGRYKNRYRYGVFRIYRFIKNTMYQVFESEGPVSNYSLDCESYEKDDLRLQNVDLNNDGYLDLKFSGIKNFFCNGLEQYGRDERKPIRKEKISMIFYYDSINQNWLQRK